MSGFTLSHRDKWDNPIFRNLLEAGIWSWMCDTAAWKETKIRFSGKLIVLKRGQIAVSERFISEGFGIGRQVVRTFLDNIEKDRMITREVTQSITIITICNYDKYQVEEKITNPTEYEQQTHHPTQDQPSPNPNKNEGNEYNKENINKHTGAEVRAPAQEKPKLENLKFEHMEPWLLQQEVSGNVITVDVRGELERFKTHFLAYGGKDKSGNIPSDWVQKFGHWLLEQQKREKLEVRHEKNIGNNQSGAVQKSSGSGREKSGRSKFDIEADRIKKQIIADFEEKQQAPPEGLHGLPAPIN